MAYQTWAFLAGLFNDTATADSPQDLQPDPSDLTEVDPMTAGPSGAAGAGLHPQALPGADPLGADGDHGDAAQALQPHGINADGPAPLQAHGDARGPQAMPHGQALGAQVATFPPADAHGAGGPQDDHGDAGGADGPQDPAAVRQVAAGPRTRAAVPVAVEWPAAAADFCLLLAVDDLPPAPFRLNRWTEVRDAAKFLRWLQADARRGPTGPRAFYGAMQADLQALQRFALQAAATDAPGPDRPSGYITERQVTE